MKKNRGGKNAPPQAIRRATYHTKARAQMIFHHSLMRQMPCFLGFGAHAASAGASRRVHSAPLRCMNLRHSRLRERFDSTWQQSLK
jgi:hypothetical protein